MLECTSRELLMGSAGVEYLCVRQVLSMLMGWVGVGYINA